VRKRPLLVRRWLVRRWRPPGPFAHPATGESAPLAFPAAWLGRPFALSKTGARVLCPGARAGR